MLIDLFFTIVQCINDCPTLRRLMQVSSSMNHIASKRIDSLSLIKHYESVHDQWFGAGESCDPQPIDLNIEKIGYWIFLKSEGLFVNYFFTNSGVRDFCFSVASSLHHRPKCVRYFYLMIDDKDDDARFFEAERFSYNPDSKIARVGQFYWIKFDTSDSLPKVIKIKRPSNVDGFDEFYKIDGFNRLIIDGPQDKQFLLQRCPSDDSIVVFKNYNERGQEILKLGQQSLTKFCGIFGLDDRFLLFRRKEWMESHCVAIFDLMHQKLSKFFVTDYHAHGEENTIAHTWSQRESKLIVYYTRVRVEFQLTIDDSNEIQLTKLCTKINRSATGIGQKFFVYDIMTDTNVALHKLNK